MNQFSNPLVATSLESLGNRCWPLRIANVEKAPYSWIFPTPWIDGPLIGPSHWEYCCFPLPLVEPLVFARITTSLVDDYGSPNHAHDKSGVLHDEKTGFFETTLHSEFPTPKLPARYGFEMLSPIADPDGSNPGWDGFGQWTGHKIGGAPFIRSVGPVTNQIRVLLQRGYRMLLQLAEPSFSLVDPRQCDDYEGEWLFQKDRFCVLIHPTTMAVCYVWG